MFCTKCGKKLEQDEIFCTRCGTARPGLRRIDDNGNEEKMNKHHNSSSNSNKKQTFTDCIILNLCYLFSITLTLLLLFTAIPLSDIVIANETAGTIITILVFINAFLLFFAICNFNDNKEVMRILYICIAIMALAGMTNFIFQAMCRSICGNTIY